MSYEKKPIKNTNLKCCESGCDDCPFGFLENNRDIDPSIPRELQMDSDSEEPDIFD